MLSILETSEPTPSLSALPSAPSITLQTYEPPTEPSENTQTPFEPINPTDEPQPTFPTLEEVFTLFSKSSVARLRVLSEQSSLSENPSEVRNHWNGFLIWMTSEVFNLKGLSEHVRNDYIRGVEE